MENFGLVVEFQVKPECLARFNELLAVNARASVVKEAGCRQFDVLESNDDPCHVVLYEIYDSPATVFVADFVGEPAINLLPGTVTADGRARLSEAARLALPVPVEAGREVVVGIRPEDLALGGEDGLAARVVAHEPLLESGLATLALDGVEEPLVVLTGPEVRLAHDDRVHVTADPRLTHVFDAETGDSLR